MQKIILFSLFLPFFLSAQTNNINQDRFPKVPFHELRITIGATPYEVDINNLFDYNYDDYDINYSGFNFEPDTYYKGATFATGAISASYMYQLTSKWSFGGVLSYSAYYNHYLDAVSDQKVGKLVRNHLGIYGRVNRTWFRKGSFSTYSSFGIGTGWIIANKTYNNQTETYIHKNLSGEFTLIGLTFGKKVYGIAEILTTGSGGHMNFGIGYRFNTKKSTH